MKDEEIKEILEGIEVVIKHDGTLEFDAKELKILLNYATKLQSNWNSLREWLEEQHRWEEYDRVEQDMMDKVLDKMNELEGVDNENN